MTTSRRRFMKAGLLAAGFAAIPLRSVLGQDWKDRDGNPFDVPIPKTDNLANYSKATFKSYINSIFQIHTTGGIVEATLIQIDDLQATRDGECFTLLFRGGTRSLRQETYPMTHPSLGTFSLLLVPAGANRNGVEGYLATINRLSFADALANPAPTRSRFMPRTSAPPPTAMPAATPAPVPAVVSDVPVIVAPVQQPATVPNSIRKPKRKKKPSFKEVDQRIL